MELVDRDFIEVVGGISMIGVDGHIICRRIIVWWNGCVCVVVLVVCVGMGDVGLIGLCRVMWHSGMWVCGIMCGRRVLLWRWEWDVCLVV